MGFSIPSFNLAVSVFSVQDVTVPARLQTMGNLAWGRRVNAITTGGTVGWGVLAAGMSLLLPKGTDIRDSSVGTLPDAVEVPTGSGRFYFVAVVDDIGKGFANEHRAAVLSKFSYNGGVVGPPWPIPIP